MILVPRQALFCNSFSLECISGFDPSPASHDSWEQVQTDVLVQLHQVLVEEYNSLDFLTN